MQSRPFHREPTIENIPINPRQLEQVHQILRLLDQMPLAEDANRRQRLRTTIRVPLFATLMNSPTLPRLRIYSRNLSPSGIAFVVRREFHSGELLVLHLQFADRPIRLLLASVVFCRYVGNGLYEVGAAFQDSAPVGQNKLPIAWLVRAKLDPVAVGA